jgi:hypothetical protein
MMTGWRVLVTSLKLAWAALMIYCAVVFLLDQEWMLMVAALSFASGSLWNRH